MEENEYLTHIAAGTDPITALATEEKPPAKNGFAWVVALITMIVVAYLLLN